MLIRGIELDSTYPEYLWYPAVLANASNSVSHLAQRLTAEINSGLDKTGDKLKHHINKEYVQNGLGIFDASDTELQHIAEKPLYAVYYFADIISRRAQIGWSTHGHSAVDVNIYGTVGSDELRGNNENTDIGKFLREYLGVDVDEITKELVAKTEAFDAISGLGSSWTGRAPTKEDIGSILRHHGEEQR